MRTISQREYGDTQGMAIASEQNTGNILTNEASDIALSSYVKDIFETFKSARRTFEDTWMECHYNYLGQYQENIKWKESEGKGTRSKIFIKLTTLKCNTAHSKIIDAMYSGRDNVPFEAIPVMTEELGIPKDIADDISNKFKQKLKDHFKLIELEETIDTAVLEMAILGTAVLKGPIIDVKRRPAMKMRTISGIPLNEIDSQANPFELTNSEEVVPIIDHIPLWEYYVDPNAKTPEESIGEIQFKRILPAQFRKLAYQGGYNKDLVLEAARRATSRDEHDLRYIQLGDNYMGENGEKDIRVSVLEYWGLVPVRMLREAGCDLPPDTLEEDSIEGLVVLAADGIVIKACVNPLGRRPFYVAPYKKRPHVIYGQGVAEMMRDSQKMVNSSARLIIDNKALSGNGLIGINIDRINTKRTGNLSVYPGKTFYVKGSFAPREAIDSISFPDITMGLQQLMEMFERFSDEETGIPKYTSGQQDSFMNKTATGISMLLTQANINLKTVMKNIDNFWIEPIVEAFHDWFMVMDESNDRKIPLKIKATGTDSLMAKEIKLENYMKFMQITSNPSDAIFLDRVKLMKNIARILEADDVLRSDEEIQQIMDQMTILAQQGGMINGNEVTPGNANVQTVSN